MSLLAGRTFVPLAILGLLASSLPAVAHRAPSGWQYPVSCCSKANCYEIDPAEVENVMGAYKILATGQFFGFSRVKISPDGHYHRCSLRGDRKTTTVCLFVPQPNA
jgi:hypothetical protein